MRIFWLGMHKVLTQTELPRLRELGFEVYNPPYRSSVRDQSANLDWDGSQYTTLPKDIFDQLSQVNFFYDPISPEIGEILNQYFDAAIVTINSTWLFNFLKVFRRKVIYRTYGERHLVSSDLWANGGANLICNRDNFWYAPHSELVAEHEHPWLRERMKVIPYHITDDVTSQRDSWLHSKARSQEIALSCPNIDDGFYHHHFLYLKQRFPDFRYRFYGVQLRDNIADPQIVGTLSRQAQLDALREASGYLYTYSDPNVCYLPPIEMMTIGGPVVYLPGSLLARYFDSRSPGFAKNPDDAREKCGRLLKGDSSFAREIISSQEHVRALYSPEHVLPIFDQTMKEMLTEDANRSAPIEIRQATPQKKRLYILFHREFDRATNYVAGGAFNAEGIGRVMRLLCQAVLERTNYDVVITVRGAYSEAPLSFFRTEPFRDRVRLLVIDRPSIGRTATGLRSKIIKGIRSAVRTFPRGRPIEIAKALGFIRKTPDGYSIFGQPEAQVADLLATSKPLRVLLLAGIALSALIMLPFYLSAKLLRPLFGLRWSFSQRLERLRQLITRLGFGGAATFINADEHAVGAIIPHYFLFEDALFVRKPTLMYIPDHIPHFYQETGDFPGEERFASTGRILARRARAVMTNSPYSKQYLPKSRLMVDPKKIVAFPLPNLNRSLPIDTSPSSDFIEKVKTELKGRRYIFYPTQNRPNKNLVLLFQVFAELAKEDRNLALVLTGSVQHYGPAHSAWVDLKLSKHTVIANGATDADLAWLYTNCACLCVTSNIEGNFPPQIFEALAYGAPIVSSELPMITEMLGDTADSLLLARMSDAEDFVSKLRVALNNREAVLLEQQKALAVLNEKANYNRFADEVATMIDQLAQT